MVAIANENMTERFNDTSTNWTTNVIDANELFRI